MTSVIEEEDATTLKNKGNEAYNKGSYREAVHYYTKAIIKDPESAKIYGNRAAGYMMLKCYHDTILDCKQAIKLDSSFVKVYGRLAKAYFFVGDFEKSLMYYHEALKIEINPDLQKELDIVETSKQCYKKCYACIENKDYAKAMSYSKMLLREAPDTTPFKLLHCEALIHNNKPDEATQLLANMLFDDVNNSEVLFMRAKGLFYTSQNQIPQAIAHLQRSLESDPDHVPSLKLIKQIRQYEQLKQEGNAHFQGKRWSEAAESYSKALDIEPSNTRLTAVLLCNRAAARKEENQYLEAIQDCTDAIAKDENYIKAYLRRGRCKQVLNHHEEAVRDFEKARQLNPLCRDIANELREAKILLKRSKKKDYYKILGVSRDADERTIKKAYREQALKLHPDKMTGATNEEKEKAEQLFKDVGEAYAVLTDPIKKRKYDNGVYDDGTGYADHDTDSGFNMFFHGGGPQVYFSSNGLNRRTRSHFAFQV